MEAVHLHDASRDTLTRDGAWRRSPQPAPQGSRRSAQITDNTDHAFLRAGRYAWATVGLGLAALIAGVVLGRLRLVVVPIGLALFPAALLWPLSARLQQLRVPRSLAALAVLLGFLGVIAGTITFLVPAVRAELPELVAQAEAGLNELEGLIEEAPFGIEPSTIREGIEDVREAVVEGDMIRTGALQVATAAAEITTMLLLMLVTLFFFLKDGDRIASWVNRLFPRGARDDVTEIGRRAWTTVGAYFRGQLVVALVDAVFIGLGLVLLGVPLALPLAVLVFFGGLFPIVGAFISGAFAVLVALASGGPGLALAVLALIVVVQQVESNLLAPIVLGKATALHPLAVIVSLTAGGILLGILGAFIAVPVAASIARGVAYVRHKHEPDIDTAPADMAAPSSEDEAPEDPASEDRSDSVRPEDSDQVGRTDVQATAPD